MITPIDIFRAYFSCRSTKRRTPSALAFEMTFEQECFALYDDLMSNRYEIGESSAFIVHSPVQREVFAVSFRDRIVHHLIADRILPTLEQLCIYDSYACRVGRGTSFGIARAEHFMRSVSENYTRPAYVLKLDIRSFFMSISHDRLMEQIDHLLYERYPTLDERDILYQLCEQIVRHHPQSHCVIRGRRSDWVGLPRSKSLFFAPHGYGLPIGNLTSQLFGNLYLHEFDRWVKQTMRIHHYGRYVDDMLFFHHSREYLEGLIPQVRDFLWERLGLTLHPDKIILRPIDRGIDYLGAIILPYRNYIRNRVKGNILRKISDITLQSHIDRSSLHQIQSSINSYLGYSARFDTYKLRREFANKLVISCPHISQLKWHNDYTKLSISYF